MKPPAGSKGLKPWSMLKGYFVDGGMVANNPTIAAISFLQRMSLDSNPANTAVLSLGCGSCWKPSAMSPTSGLVGAGLALSDILLGANCDTAVAAGEMQYRTVSVVQLEVGGQPYGSFCIVPVTTDSSRKVW